MTSFIKLDTHTREGEGRRQIQRERRDKRVLSINLRHRLPQAGSQQDG
jgi:hypothetical protein